MALKEKLNNDVVQALKNKDALSLETLRFLLASIHNREIEKRSKNGSDVLTDEEVLEVLNKEAKKRKEAAALYERGGRKDLVEKELAELKIIQKYLPAEISEEEILKTVREIISKSDVAPKDFGKTMGEIMKVLKGKADAARVSEIVKKELEKKISG